MNREELFASLNRGMLDERGMAFFRNLEKNIPLIRQFGGLGEVMPRMHGRHVIIAGAGPSLDREIAALKSVRDDNRFIVIAADMALRPLYLNGIIPDFVITCETTPTDFFSGIKTESMHLLAFSCSSCSSLRRWRGGISFYNWMIEGEFYNKLWDISGRGLGYVATGSIVTTQAVSIAMGSGISSLMLAGNDLGFYDRFYASETVSMKKKSLGINRLSTFSGMEMELCRKCRAYEVIREGRTLYTNRQFLAARLWLEELFGREPFPVADSSFPGCSSAMVYKIGLEEYIWRIRNHMKDGEE